MAKNVILAKESKAPNGKRIFAAMIEHTLTLHGPDCADGKPRPGTIGPILSLLVPVLRDNLRQAFFASSRIEGRPCKDLRQAWDVRFVGMSPHEDESTRLRFEMRSLGEAAPKFYELVELWEDAPGAEETAFDLFGYTLVDIGENNLESSRFDLPLLRRVDRFRKVFAKDVSRITFGGHFLSNGHPPPPLDQPLIDRIGSLANTTPAPRRVRVQGRLDMVRCSDRVFELILKDGVRLRAVWAPENLAPIAEFLDTDVLVEGEAVFRPSGSVLRLDAEAIRPSEARDAFFSQMPAPLNGIVQTARESRLPAGRRAGIEAIAGNWPGDESIEDLVRALAELGR